MWGASFITVEAANDHRFYNHEYKLSVDFPGTPAGNRVCTALSGSHPHGFYAWYGGQQACRRAGIVPAVTTLSIYADYNSTYERTPADELLEACRNGSGSRYITPVELRKLSFNGRKSAVCAIDKADGSIEVEVVTQAGKWPDADSGMDSKAPWINYDAWLRTYPDRVRGDVETLREFLANVKVWSN